MDDEAAAALSMQALVKEEVACGARRIARPSMPDPDEVVVRVAWAGICRTDLYAAEGRLPTLRRVVLGHEASGVIHSVGSRVASLVRDGSSAPLQIGDHVTVIPRTRCGACASCTRPNNEGLPLDCDAPQRLGLDRDGVFAEYVCLPVSSVAIVPRTLPLRLAAYVEPVAAALAVLSKAVDLRSTERGLIYGTNRIAELTRRALHACGIDNVSIVSEKEAAQVEPRSFDFAIETTATPSMFSTLLRAVRRSGRIVLKSRPFEPVPLDVNEAVEKEISIHAVRYAPFADAIGWLDSRHLIVDDLLGDDYALDGYQEAFEAARKEAKKPFFRLSPPFNAADAAPNARTAE